MTKRHLARLAKLGIAMLLLTGMGRASVAHFLWRNEPLEDYQKQKDVPGLTSRFQERQRALTIEAVAEQRRLGLTNRQALFAKYPTPEVTLCRMTRAVPGGTAEVVTRGKFAAGTKFLFENDAVQVVQENATASEYRARVSVAAGGGPTFAYLHTFAPVSAGTSRCLALYIGGNYEWDFVAENNWRIKLRMLKEPFRAEDTNPPAPLYRAEFYRGTEAKPFESFDAKLSIEAAPWEGAYAANLDTEEEQNPDAAEMAKLQEQMMNMHKLSPQEQEKLIARMQQLGERMAQQAMDQASKMQENEKRMRAFGCNQIHFRLKPDGVTGHLACTNERGLGAPVNFKGTMKYVGP